MWFVQEGVPVLEKRDDGKVRVRIINNSRGVQYFQYDETFKLIGSGVSLSVNHAMEKFNG
jgi:hypothetical protein